MLVSSHNIHREQKLIVPGLPEGAIAVAAEALKQLKPSSARHDQKRSSPWAPPNTNPVNIFEKVDSEGFKFIGNFISARRAGQFLGVSGSAIIKYMHSGEVYKDRYRLSSQAPR